MTQSKKQTAKKSSPKSNATKAGAKISSGRLAGARQAVNLPIDAVRGAANRVGSFVSPVTDRVGGDQKVTALRGQVEDLLRQAEKRGESVFANKKLKNLGNRAEKVQTDLTKALESRAGRAQELIGQARDQLSNLRS